MSSLVVVSSERLAVCLKHLVVIGKGDFKLVHAFAVIASRLLTLSLFKGHTLVELNHFFMMLDLASVILILEHASHASGCLDLSSPVLFLLLVAIGLVAPLTHLLIGPLLLHRSVVRHSLVVH